MCTLCGFGGGAYAVSPPLASPGNAFIGAVQGTTTIAANATATVGYSIAVDAAALSFVDDNYDAVSTVGAPLTTLTGPLGSFVADEVRLIFDLYSQYTPLTFIETTPFDTGALKVIGVDGAPNYSGRAVFPGTDPDPSGQGFEGYLLIDTGAPIMRSGAEVGGASFRMWVIAHEIGHLLGLGHPTDNGNGSGRWSQNEPIDNGISTVMGATRGNTTSGHLVGPGPVDVAALHRMYGATQNNTGDTYYWLTDGGTTPLDLDGSDGIVSVGRATLTIWDTSGTDTIGYAGSKDVLINLNAATFRDKQAREWHTDWATEERVFELGFDERANVMLPDYGGGGSISQVIVEGGGYTIAGASGTGSVGRYAGIENADGGSGDDILIGNEKANRINAAAGDDLAHGSSGNDTLSGAAGSDTLYGGTGSDRLNGGDGADSLVGGAGKDILSGNGGSDTLRGEGGNDLLRGGDQGDSLLGESGHDTLRGEGGADTMDGGAGADIVDGEDGQDSLIGGDGADTLYGGADRDTLEGGEADDLLFGNTGDDRLLGNNGNDDLRAGDGGDTLDGGTGNDALQGQGGSDLMRGGADNDTLEGQNGDDTLDGGVGDDRLVGHSGNNVFLGGAGDDTMRINGTNDTVTGGSGADVFRIGANTMARIEDFALAEDTLDLASWTGSASATAGVGGALIANANASVLLIDVSVSDAELLI